MNSRRHRLPPSVYTSVGLVIRIIFYNIILRILVSDVVAWVWAHTSLWEDVSWTP